MYQLNNQQQWDTDFFHTLMSDKRITSSREAKEIREKLSAAGAIPHLDHNYDWAMLCIGYCFARGLTDSPHKLYQAPDTKGIEIPSFQTCFQDYSRLWLVLLSDILFSHYPNKPVSKDDLYQLIHSLWHTGAIELANFWEGCKRFRPGNELAARQAFLNELAELAIKNSGTIDPTRLKAPQQALEEDGLTLKHPQELELRLQRALQHLDISVNQLSFLSHGARYDIFRLRLHKYYEINNILPKLCSELGIKETSLLLTQCYNGESHAYDLKLLRDERLWQRLGVQKFNEAIASYDKDYALPFCVGIDEYGNARFEDLSTAPHLLIGGTTGSGKSVFMRTLLRSLFDLNRNQDKLEVAILDPKKVDYLIFEKEEDLWEERILDDHDEIYTFLQDSVTEAENRYQLMKEYGVQKLSELPARIRPPYRVILVDELANLIKQNKHIELQLIMLAEKARASGIHLVLSTQRPDAQTLAGTLRSNLPSRIALSVQKSTESKIILDETGAEKLAGKGDHLVKWNGQTTYFLHGFEL